jgi:hypothetical protein
MLFYEGDFVAVLHAPIDQIINLLYGSHLKSGMTQR